MSGPLPSHSPARPDHLIGQAAGRYLLQRRVGEGGMGVVYLGESADGQLAAVKVLREHVAGDPDARRRLAREFETLRRVRHQRVARVLDADVDGRLPYIATEYIDGDGLQTYVQERGTLRGPALARLGLGLGDALAAIHRSGVVHRDLKPGNVLVVDGDPVVIDFGIAHASEDSRLTMTGLVMGTPGYLSPELLEGGTVERATDWWGWAATMVFAATGRSPFGRGPMEVVLDRVRRGEADLDGVPLVLVPVLRAALSAEPGRRPRPRELRAALHRLSELGDNPPTATFAYPIADVPTESAASTRTDATQVYGAGPTVVQTAETTQAYGGAETDEATALHEPDPTLVHPLERTRLQPVQRRERPAPVVQSAPPHQPQPYPAQPQHAVPPQQYLAHPQPYPPQLQPAPHARQPYPQSLQPHHLQPQQLVDPRQQLQPSLRPNEVRPQPASRPRRTGTVLLGWALLIAAGTWLPVLTLAGFAVLSVLARTADRIGWGLVLRRHEHGGRRPSDLVVATLAAPWHLVVACLSAAFALLLPLVLGACAAVGAELIVPTAGLGATDPAGPGPLSLAAGFATLGLTSWWGFGGRSLRGGTRSLVRGLAPGRAGATLLGLLLMAALAAVAFGLVGTGLVSNWTPLTSPTLHTPTWLR